MQKSLGVIADYVNAAICIEIGEFVGNQELAEDVKYVFSLGDPSRGKTELMFECGKAFSINRQTLLPFAIAAELMMASAMNDDDIIDRNESRYGEKPLYFLKGIPTAIMVSGYMYALIFSILKKYRPPSSSQFFNGYLKSENLLVDYFRLMHEAQYSTTRKFDFRNFHLQDLNRLAYGKAGLLYQFCVSAPAYLTDKDTSVFEEFGQKLGVAVQFQSDIRDFVANPADPDKPTFRLEDYATGQPNLVLLTASKSDFLSQKDKNWMIDSWSSQKNQNFEEVLRLIKKSGAISKSAEYLYAIQKGLAELIEKLPFNELAGIKQYLRELISGLC